MLRTVRPATRFRTFLLILSAFGIGFILLATSKYGAGVSSDAARNLSTADSLLAGQGFVDMVGAPLILWPPLYPLILAALSWLTNCTTFQAAWYLNIVLYAVNIWLAGWLLYRILRGRAFWAGAGALMILLSRSALRIHANVASEPLFETLMLLFFLAAANWLEDASPRALRVMCLLAGLASMQRYLGVVLIAVAAVVIFRRERLRGIGNAAIPLLTALAPIAAWLLLHNYAVSGTLFGPRDLGAMFPLENVSLSLTKIMWWFVPRVAFLDPLLLAPWIPVAFLTLLLITINRKTDWLKWSHAISDPYVWPALLFSLLYFFLLAFTVVTADHLDLTSDRYYVVILPVVVALLFISFDILVLAHINPHTRVVSYVLAGLMALWFAYPLYSLQVYLRQALVHGEPTNYNIANSANFREMSVVKAAQPILEKDPSALVYSNYLNIVWFIYHHPVQTLPFEDATQTRTQRLIALKQYYPNWPPQAGYIIWFTPNQYHHIVSPEELITISDLRLLYQDKTGQIYAVQPKH